MPVTDSTVAKFWAWFASDLRLLPLPDPVPAGAVPLAELPALIDRAVGRT